MRPPCDVDVALHVERDDRMNEAVVQALFSGHGNPYAPLRRALAGTSRGLQILYDDSAREQLVAEGTVMLPLWRRGDTLAQAMTVLHGIPEDANAGRAERHDMIAAFDGLDRYIPRSVRAELIGWQHQEFITISRTTLLDAPQDTDLLSTPDMRWAFRHWGEDSPLRRAALAGLAHLRGLGVELDDIELHARRCRCPRRGKPSPCPPTPTGPPSGRAPGRRLLRLGTSGSSRLARLAVFNSFGSGSVSEAEPEPNLANKATDHLHGENPPISAGPGTVLIRDRRLTDRFRRGSQAAEASEAAGQFE